MTLQDLSPCHLSASSSHYAISRQEKYSDVASSNISYTAPKNIFKISTNIEPWVGLKKKQYFHFDYGFIAIVEYINITLITFIS